MSARVVRPEVDWRRWRTLRAAVAAPLGFALLASLVSGTQLDPATYSTGEPNCPLGRTTPVAPVSYQRAARAPQLPLAFVANVGQADPAVQYVAQGDGLGVFFMKDMVVLSFTNGERGGSLQLVPLGTGTAARVEAAGPGPGWVNSLADGNHHIDLPTYQEIAYRDLWPGIDLIFRTEGSALKYEFHLAPGADPSQIRLAHRGAKRLSDGVAGDLLVESEFGTLRQSRPQSSQQVGGQHVPIESRYLVDERAIAYSVELGEYDQHVPVVLGLGLTYSTMLGGTSNDFGIEIAVDEAGSAYVTGQTVSPDFPTSPGAFDAAHHGTADAFVAKLDPSGSTLVYSTFLGGTGAEAGLAIDVDREGRAHVSGGTSSPDFPTTPGAFDTKHNGRPTALDVFVAKLDHEGSTLVYSTLLGGVCNDAATDIAVDQAGDTYVTGGTDSPDLPTTRAALDPSRGRGPLEEDAFVAKLDAKGARLLYSTYLGGSALDRAQGLALGSDTSAYVTGWTESKDFPTTAKAFDADFKGVEDGFVTKLNPNGTELVYSTYLAGRSRDRGRGIAVDARGSAYVTGATSSPDFPTRAGALDADFNGVEDAFVTKLNRKGTGLVYSTYVGGSAIDFGRGIAIDEDGSAYITGRTESSDFPVSNGALQTSSAGGRDAFVVKLGPVASDESRPSRGLAR